MNTLRSQVLKNFKKLHRTRMKVFAGDAKALLAAKIKINDEFRKNKHVINEESLKTLIKLAEDVETHLRTQVIQAKEVKPGVYQAIITEDTVKLDNVEFDPNAVLPVSKRSPCCKDQAKGRKRE